MSTDEARRDRFDRHALVTTIWLPVGMLAVMLLHYGFQSADTVWIAAGYAALLVGFALHVIVNAALGTGFTAREVALGLGLYLLAVLALGVAMLTVDTLPQRTFLTAALGLAVLAIAVVFYMITRFGPRRAFEQFDVIRDNNPRRASRLRHRGGRR